MKTATRLIMCALALGLIVGCRTRPVKTIENLKTAYNGELTASAKYASFAEKAKSEGYDTIAIMFMATSKSEAIHAANHLKVLEKLGEKTEVSIIGKFDILSTKVNLVDAIKGETYEIDKMYPGFISTAGKEKCTDGVKSFTWAFLTEKKHKEFYETALLAINGGGEGSLPATWFVCPVCGNTYNNTSVTAACELCLTTPSRFIVFE
jgi:rubrerythrin